MGAIGCPETLVVINRRCVTYQKSEELIYIADEVRNTVNKMLMENFKKCVEKKIQLDATECFIALMICSTCFGNFYAHHQELETICVYVITAYGVQCLVAGCRGSGAGQQGVRPGRGMLHDAVVQHPSC